MLLNVAARSHISGKPQSKYAVVDNNADADSSAMDQLKAVLAARKLAARRHIVPERDEPQEQERRPPSNNDNVAATKADGIVIPPPDYASKIAAQAVEKAEADRQVAMRIFLRKELMFGTEKFHYTLDLSILGPNASILICWNPVSFFGFGHLDFGRFSI